MSVKFPTNGAFQYACDKEIDELPRGYLFRVRIAGLDGQVKTQGPGDLCGVIVGGDPSECALSLFLAWRTHMSKVKLMADGERDYTFEGVIK